MNENNAECCKYTPCSVAYDGHGMCVYLTLHTEGLKTLYH